MIETMEVVVTNLLGGCVLCCYMQCLRTLPITVVVLSVLVCIKPFETCMAGALGSVTTCQLHLHDCQWLCWQHLGHFTVCVNAAGPKHV
jgi:hypothetical protein